MPRAKKEKTVKVKSLAERLISEFKLVTAAEYILFPDSKDIVDDEWIKFQEKYAPEQIDNFVHTKSFMRNPLRYLPQMIQNCKGTKASKAAKFEKINEIVKLAMADDPLNTVKSIIYSLARHVKF